MYLCIYVRRYCMYIAIKLHIYKITGNKLVQPDSIPHLKMKTENNVRLIVSLPCHVFISLLQRIMILDYTFIYSDYRLISRIIFGNIEVISLD